ncbi:MAG: hypothetical protein HY876_10050, partial [Coriobacteriales bacterium]|nr:hypothetical protein [Coriobacteriales bacterium]
MFAFAAVAVIAVGMVVNPPTGGKHAFTKDSDYRSESESGCTNSGKGCHGDEDSYDDFNTYHPNAKCTSCHDYQGASCIPCHSPNSNHECQECHDGSVEEAADTVRLTDPYPRGHYRETTHTATGEKMSAEVRGAQGGKAQATCRDCHSRDLRASHTDVPEIDGSSYGDEIGCGECHNDTRAGGQAQVLSDWKGRTCGDCHTAKSSAPMHGTDVVEGVKAKSSQRCGSTGTGCHEGNDLHALHPDAPKTCSGSSADGEPGCHELDTEAKKPTAVTCGGKGEQTCHLGYRNTDSSHKNYKKAHAPKLQVAAEDTSYEDIACGSCHRMGADSPSLTEEHALATSERTATPKDACRNCHAHPASQETLDDGWEARDDTEACSTCHGHEGLGEGHADDLTDVHTATDSMGCASSGPGCHPTADLAQVGRPTTSANLHRDCLRCHDWTRSNGNVAYDPSADSCGSGRECHGVAGQYDPATSVHAGSRGLTDGGEAAHHTASARQAASTLTDVATGRSVACSECHTMALGAEHTRPNSSLAKGVGNACSRCHNYDSTTSSAVKGDWLQREGTGACAECHEDGSAGSPHVAIGTSHVGRELQPNGVAKSGYCTDSGCHEDTDLRRLHAAQGCTVSGCHSPAGDIFGRNTASCGGSDPAVACHARVHTLIDGNDIVHHVAGSAQAKSIYEDEASGVRTACVECHTMFLTDEHERANSSIAAGAGR